MFSDKQPSTGAELDGEVSKVLDDGDLDQGFYNPDVGDVVPVLDLEQQGSNVALNSWNSSRVPLEHGRPVVEEDVEVVEKRKKRKRWVKEFVEEEKKKIEDLESWAFTMMRKDEQSEEKLVVVSNEPIIDANGKICYPEGERQFRPVKMVPKWHELYKRVGGDLHWQEKNTFPPAGMKKKHMNNPSKKLDGVICVANATAHWRKCIDSLIDNAKLLNPDVPCWVTRFVGIGDVCEKVNLARYMRKLEPLLFRTTDGNICDSEGDFDEESNDASKSLVASNSVATLKRNTSWSALRDKRNENPGKPLNIDSDHLTEVGEAYKTFWNRVPSLFVLPEDSEHLERFFMKKTRWFKTVIVKPECGSQGKGIFLAQSLFDVQLRLGNSGLRDRCQAAVVQRYIKRPFLMTDRLKFDFRIYVVIVGHGKDRRVFICKEGLARFCTEKYPENPDMYSTQAFVPACAEQGAEQSADKEAQAIGKSGKSGGKEDGGGSAVGSKKSSSKTADKDDRTGEIAFGRRVEDKARADDTAIAGLVSGGLIAEPTPKKRASVPSSGRVKSRSILAHLTNFSLNKKAANYVSCGQEEEMNRLQNEFFQKNAIGGNIDANAQNSSASTDALQAALAMRGRRAPVKARSIYGDGGPNATPANRKSTKSKEEGDAPGEPRGESFQNQVLDWGVNLRGGVSTSGIKKLRYNPSKEIEANPGSNANDAGDEKRSNSKPLSPIDVASTKTGTASSTSSEAGSQRGGRPAKSSERKHAARTEDHAGARDEEAANTTPRTGDDSTGIADDSEDFSLVGNNGEQPPAGAFMRTRSRSAESLRSNASVASSVVPERSFGQVASTPRRRGDEPLVAAQQHDKAGTGPILPAQLTAITAEHVAAAKEWLPSAASARRDASGGETRFFPGASFPPSRQEMEGFPRAQQHQQPAGRPGTHALGLNQQTGKKEEKRSSCSSMDSRMEAIKEEPVLSDDYFASKRRLSTVLKQIENHVAYVNEIREKRRAEREARKAEREANQDFVPARPPRMKGGDFADTVNSGYFSRQGGALLGKNYKPRFRPPVPPPLEYSEEDFWEQVESLVAKWVVLVDPVLEATQKQAQRSIIDDACSSDLYKPSSQYLLGHMPKSAQILGFDLLLDSRLKLHMLEMNSCPSLLLDETVVDEVNGDCCCKANVKPHFHRDCPVDVCVKKCVAGGLFQIIRCITEGDEVSGALGDDFLEIDFNSSEHEPLQNLRELFERIENVYQKFFEKKNDKGGNPFTSLHLRRVFKPLIDTEFQTLTNADLDIIALRLKEGVFANHYSKKNPAQLMFADLVGILETIRVKKNFVWIEDVLDVLEQQGEGEGMVGVAGGAGASNSVAHNSVAGVAGCGVSATAEGSSATADDNSAPAGSDQASEEPGAEEGEGDDAGSGEGADDNDESSGAADDNDESVEDNGDVGDDDSGEADDAG